MASKTPIITTPKEKCRCDTIMSQQELNTKEHEVQDQVFIGRYGLNKMMRLCFTQKVLVCCVFIKPYNIKFKIICILLYNNISYN